MYSTNFKFLAWLITFRAAVKYLPAKNARETFVHGLHGFDAIWHFDDDANDCNFGEQEAKLLNEIRDILYHEELFEIALKLNN